MPDRDKSWSAASCILSALFVCGCGAGEFATSGPIVRDSAGIRIVENAAPLWSPGEAWRVSASPLLEIGVVEGDSLYQLYGVRGTERLSDGTIVVANGGTHQLRFYDAAGRFLRSAGRQGGGPGEFQLLSALTRFRGDSLAVFDSRSRRVTIFGPDGTYARDVSTVRTDAAESPPSVIGALAGGVLVGRRTIRAAARSDGYTRDSLALVLLSPEGAPVGAAGPFPGAEIVREESSPRPGILRVREASLPFARSTDVAVATGRVFVGTSDAYEIRAYDSAGTLERLIRRLGVQPPEVTSGLFDRYVEWRIGRTASAGSAAPPALAELREQLEGFPRVPAAPAFGEILADDAGCLWVRDAVMPWDAAGNAPSWTVFDPDGRMLGTVSTPPGLRILRIGADFILGTRRDELAVEYVQVFGLER